MPKQGVWVGEPVLVQARVVRVARPAAWSSREWAAFMAVIDDGYDLLFRTAEAAVYWLPDVRAPRAKGNAQGAAEIFRDTVGSVLDVLRESLPETRI